MRNFTLITLATSFASSWIIMGLGHSAACWRARWPRARAAPRSRRWRRVSCTRSSSRKTRTPGPAIRFEHERWHGFVQLRGPQPGQEIPMETYKEKLPLFPVRRDRRRGRGWVGGRTSPSRGRTSARQRPDPARSGGTDKLWNNYAHTYINTSYKIYRNF